MATCNTRIHDSRLSDLSDRHAKAALIGRRIADSLQDKHNKLGRSASSRFTAFRAWSIFRPHQSITHKRQ
eukprot:2486008-Pleurochrysis_carterae.AAC.2